MEIGILEISSKGFLRKIRRRVMQHEQRELMRLIEESEGVDFGEFGQGVSDEWILRAETRLGIKLPPSYVWWLKNYGGGAVYGDEIFTIYEQDFDTVVGCDIVHMHELNVREQLFSNDQLVIYEPDDAVYYFDLKQRDEDNEYPVYEYYSGKKIADDFIEFLIRLIRG
jgi:hypothetical protein